MSVHILSEVHNRISQADNITSDILVAIEEEAKITEIKTEEDIDALKGLLGREYKILKAAGVNHQILSMGVIRAKQCANGTEVDDFV